MDNTVQCNKCKNYSEAADLIDVFVPSQDGFNIFTFCETCLRNVTFDLETALQGHRDTKRLSLGIKNDSSKSLDVVGHKV